MTRLRNIELEWALAKTEIIFWLKPFFINFESSS